MTPPPQNEISSKTLHLITSPHQMTSSIKPTQQSNFARLRIIEDSSSHNINFVICKQFQLQRFNKPTLLPASPPHFNSTSIPLTTLISSLSILVFFNMSSLFIIWWCHQYLQSNLSWHFLISVLIKSLIFDRRSNLSDWSLFRFERLIFPKKKIAASYSTHQQ